MPDAELQRVLARVDADFPAVVERLKLMVAIPSCSFPGFDPATVEASAQATADWLGEAGFPSVEILRLPGVNPYVLATDRRAGAGRPTLVLYAHHDVQPPMRAHEWRSPPFTATERDGRLFGRGAADDKGGIAVHAASAAAWNRVRGAPPVNLVVVVEGEEEVGSHHFGDFIARYRDRLACDAVVIADLQNFDTGLPSLTTSLRGLVVLELEARALDAPVHSGMWGGAVVDPALALCRLIASLTDASGALAVDGVAAPTPLTDIERANLARLPFDRAQMAAQAGMRAEALPADGATVYRRLWREPSVSVNVLQCGERGRTGNVVMDSAYARVGVRLAPGMEPGACALALEGHLRARAPIGLELGVSASFNGPAWSTDTAHPLFATAHRALEIGYGRRAVEMGCGGSIPFVGEFCARLGGVPALLLGVEDPVCGAHSENESVHLGDLRSAIRSQAALFGLMASEAP